MAAVGLAAWACGGAISLRDTPPDDASTAESVSSAGEAGMAAAADAGPGDTGARNACGQRAMNGQPSGCPASDYCVLWLASDASLEGVNGLNPFPKDAADIVQTACAGGPGSFATACDGGAPVVIVYSVYDNYATYVDCVEP
jgi:hypothetical protein